MDFGQQYLIVAAVLALFGATLWWLRRRGHVSVGSGRRGRVMEAVERLPLGPQHTLHLVRVGDTALLVAASPGGCVLLESLPAARLEKREGAS